MLPSPWFGSNLVGVPAHELASAGFNAQTTALAIAGTREAHPGLFAMLDRSPDLLSARELFVRYLADSTELHRPEPVNVPQRRWHSGWRKLLQGWGMDANGPAGAVLKGWVESRFGLLPAFHKAPLAHYPSAAWVAYLEEKSGSRYAASNVLQQLDLLYEFCQWALRTCPTPGLIVPPSHLRLWRGSTRSEEQLVAGRLQDKTCTVRLNNLVSFSLSRDDAGCFGDWIFEALVPCCKVLVYPGLLPGQVLQGEQEVLVLGGDYTVKARYV